MLHSNNYLKVLEGTVFSEFTRALEDEAWEVTGEKYGVTISKKMVHDGSVNCVKGTGIINAPPHEIFDVVWDVSKRSQWDRLVESAVEKKAINERAKLVYIQLAGQFPAYPRDLCVVAFKHILEDGSYIMSIRSVLHDEVPVVSGRIRAELLASGFLIEPLTADSSLVTYVVQLDSKGWLPNFISNLINEYQPLRINTLRSFILKNQVQSPPTEGLIEDATVSESLETASPFLGHSSHLSSELVEISANQVHRSLEQSASGVQSSGEELEAHPLTDGGQLQPQPQPQPPLMVPSSSSGMISRNHALSPLHTDRNSSQHSVPVTPSPHFEQPSGNNTDGEDEEFWETTADLSAIMQAAMVDHHSGSQQNKDPERIIKDIQSCFDVFQIELQHQQRRQEQIQMSMALLERRQGAEQQMLQRSLEDQEKSREMVSEFLRQLDLLKKSHQSHFSQHQTLFQQLRLRLHLLQQQQLQLQLRQRRPRSLYYWGFILLLILLISQLPPMLFTLQSLQRRSLFSSTFWKPLIVWNTRLWFSTWVVRRVIGTVWVFFKSFLLPSSSDGFILSSSAPSSHSDRALPSTSFGRSLI